MKAKGSQNFGHPAGPDGRNPGTVILGSLPSKPTTVDLGALFASAYAQFAPACREVAEPGVAIVAIDECTHRLAGLTRVLARPGHHGIAIIGRHERCDLPLDGREHLALRQIALVLDPVVTWQQGRSETSYRLLDLRTAHGFQDEHGRALRGLRSDGATVLRCAGYALFVLPLGDPTDWPERGTDAWAFLPERVYFDEVTHLARGSSARIVRAPSASARTTRVTVIPGPREPDVSLVADGDLAGTLELVGWRGSELIPVGQAALRDGVLLGRYSRCDSSTVDDDSVSRVHALLIELDQALLLIDTASSNGTRGASSPPARVHQLQPTHELWLGARTLVRWRSHGAPAVVRRPARA